ncbi:MAG: hypothetical protein ABEJ28_07360 [Salinigranum sp.]
MVELNPDSGLTVSIERGTDDWAYAVSITYDGDPVTEYGSNFEPWGRAGRKILGNILARRIDAYDSRERVGELLSETFEGREAELEDALGPA